MLVEDWQNVMLASALQVYPPRMCVNPDMAEKEIKEALPEYLMQGLRNLDPTETKSEESPKPVRHRADSLTQAGDVCEQAECSMRFLRGRSSLRRF